MTYSTAPAKAFSFIKTDAAEKFDRPAVLTAGYGPEPDYSQLALSEIAQPGIWRAQVPEIVAKALRVKPPYVPPPDDSTSPPPIVPPAATGETKGESEVPAAVVDTNPPGAL